MEWNKQTEDMFKTWTETQQKMWDQWLTAMQGFTQSRPTNEWGKTVETWEEALTRTLDAQADWTRLWTGSFNSLSGAPKEMVEWARQGEEMMRRLTETQKQLWNGWFQVAKKLDPSALGGNWEQESRKQFQTWREGMQKALDAQAEWVRLWTGQAAKMAKTPQGAQV